MEEIICALTSAMIENQKQGKPVHEWKLADIENIKGWQLYAMLVEEFMTTDVFTVHENDLPDLVADVMVWQKIKYLPVGYISSKCLEDEKGKRKGLITFRGLLKYYPKEEHLQNKETMVKSLMESKSICMEPETTVNIALQLMKKHKVDCLPVVKNNRLKGINRRQFSSNND